MKFTALLYILFVVLTGCAAIPESRFKRGDVVWLEYSVRNPNHYGEYVLVIEPLKWRWIKGGNTLIVYEIETVDGSRLAAQEYQLKPSAEYSIYSTR